MYAQFAIGRSVHGCLLQNQLPKADFHELYEKMNGMELREMDRIIYSVCTLCRDHEKAGFMEGIKVGIRLRNELEEFR